MQPCLHPATLDPGLDLPTFARVAADAGFLCIEYAARRLLDYDGDDRATLRALLNETTIVPVHCGWSAGLRSTRADFDAALSRTEEEMAFAARFGSRSGTLVLPFRREPNVPDPDDADTLDRIRQIADRAAAHRLNVVLEFVGLHIPDAPLHTHHDLRSTVALIERVGRPNVGVLLDVYHWHLSGGTVAEIAAIPVGTPLFVHINDAPPGDVATLDDSMRLLPGEGVIDLPAFLGAIAARGYDGPVSVEIFSARLRAMPPAEAARLAFATTSGAIRQVTGPSDG